MSQISKYSLMNINNYNINFQDTFANIFIKYMTIINEYLKHYLDNITIQNYEYYLYIIKRGIETINHVFNFLLIYTKNLDIVYDNCQKAYIYYIEFIGQIGEDNHSFLQLNSKDATLFVYKKTIFDINSDMRKNYINNKKSNKIISDIGLFIKIYNNILYKLISNYKLITVIKYINIDVYSIMQKIIKLYIEQNYQDNSNKIASLLLFSIYFKNENIIEVLDIFLKKIRKKKKINLFLLEHYLIENTNLSNIKSVSHLINNICID